MDPSAKAVLAAYLTTIAVLIVAAVGGWFEIRSYGMPLDGEPQFPAVGWPVGTFISAWIAVTVVALSLWMWKVR